MERLHLAQGQFGRRLKRRHLATGLRGWTTFIAAQHLAEEKAREKAMEARRAARRKAVRIKFVAYRDAREKLNSWTGPRKFEEWLLALAERELGGEGAAQLPQVSCWL